MRIAITNESYLTEVQISRLKEIGDVTVYADTNADNIVERLEGVEIAVVDCFLSPITEDVLSKLPNLKYFTINSTGHDLVDSQALKKHGVIASNVPGFSTEAVAEIAIGLMFAVNRKIPKGDAAFRKKSFQVEPGASEEADYIGFNLRGKTLGVIGLGEIGLRVAEIAQGIGMKVIAYNRTPKEVSNITMEDLDTVIKNADVLSLNLALTKELEYLIDAEKIALMKESAIIINTARGGLINDTDLSSALIEGSIAGAGLDVIDDYSMDNPLFSAPNVVFAPHNGFNTVESQKNMSDTVMANINAYISGDPQNII